MQAHANNVVFQSKDTIMIGVLDQVIAELDLKPIVYRLRQKMKWAAERIDAAVHAYREFLQQIRDDGRGVRHQVPSEDVDEVWHAHILHTKKYAADCASIFGWFLHHKPHAPSAASHSTLHPASAECAPLCGDECGGCEDCSGGCIDDDL